MHDGSKGMDVRCERCKTLYELDDTRVAEAGTAVRCTTCGHVFRVRKKVLLITEAVSPGAESGAIPPPVAEKPQWRVRSPSGRVIAFRELTSMQKWIVERKFGREDEISLHGDSWKRLGEIAELQPFFLLLDEVDRVRELEERLRRAEELPDEAASLLENELGTTSPALPPAPDQPVPTPIRLDSPIDAPASATLRMEPEGADRTLRMEPPGFDRTLRTEPPPPDRPRGPAPRNDSTIGMEPPRPELEPRRTVPAAFSLEEIQEATRPSPDDPTMPTGTIEPTTADATTAETAEDPDQPAFTRRAGMGGGASLDEDWEGGDRKSKAPLIATILVLAAVGAAAAAYFQIWVPAQEEKLRSEATRARVDSEQRARAAQQEADLREREQRAKEELIAGLAGKADAGSPADAGTAAASPRGGLDGEKPPGTTPTSLTGAVASASRPSAEGGRPRSPAPPARTFEEWMAQGDREQGRARARAALDAYDRAIALEPDRPEAHVARGRALLDLGNPAGAAGAFGRALEINPRYSVADFWLGEAFRRAGRKDEAVSAYGRYLEAAPEGAEAARAREALKALQE